MTVFRGGVKVFCPGGVDYGYHHSYGDNNGWATAFVDLRIKGNGALVVERRRVTDNCGGMSEPLILAAFAPGEWLRAIEVADD